MEFLHRWSDEDTCTYIYFLVDKQRSLEVMIDLVERHFKTFQVSPI